MPQYFKHSPVIRHRHSKRIVQIYRIICTTKLLLSHDFRKHERSGFYAQVSLKKHRNLQRITYCHFNFRKDHESNRLTSGILQLNNNTHLILDETKLKAGKLNASGVQAVGALAKAMQSQVVCYDFGFNATQEFNCDIPFLIFSEGKSMLPVKY